MEEAKHEETEAEIIAAGRRVMNDILQEKNKEKKDAVMINPNIIGNVDQTEYPEDPRTV